jgi:hypothetical protein
MKNLTTLLGISTIVISGTIAPLNALAQTPKVEPDSKVEQPLLGNPVPLSQKMAIYNECIDAHSKMNGADFKQVNKFCSCVVDQSVQGDNVSGFGTCASASSGGGAMGIIGEVAPSVITGVMEGINSRSSKGGSGLLGGLLGGRGDKGGSLIDGLGGLGGLLGGGDSGGFNIKDILKNRF